MNYIQRISVTSHPHVCKRPYSSVIAGCALMVWHAFVILIQPMQK